jgi:prophage DNA circulation protein
MTAAWRGQLRKGTFRGVAFFIDRHDFEGGRRVVDHLFPYKDEAWTEDLGRKQRVYKLNLYVLGNDYFRARDALVTALEKGGPGILSHPYFGNKTVEAADFNVTESSQEGGIALISATFRETGRLPSPQGALDFFEQAKEKASALETALQTSFEKFNSTGSTTFVFESGTALITKASNALYAASNLGPNKSALAIADLAYSIRNLKANARQLIQKPGQLAAQLQDAVKLLTSTLDVRGIFPEDSRGRVALTPNARAAEAQTGKASRAVFKPLLSFGDDLPPKLSNTALRRQEATNQDLMRHLIVGTAIAEAVIVSTGTTYATYEEAIDERAELIENINTLLEDESLPDEVYDTLQAVAAVAVQGIPDPANEAPRLAKITIMQPTPSLVIAYDLYDNLSLENDIIVRNQIANPAFISPLKPLEVLVGV